MSAPVLERRASDLAGPAERPLGPTRGWGPALRMARRDLRRHPGRTAAAAVMVLVPVLLASGLAAALATLELSQEEWTLARMGSADLIAQPDLYAAAVPAPTTDAAVSDLVGGPVLRVEDQAAVVAAAGGRALSTSSLVTDFTDPRADGLAEVVEGRLPGDAGEVAVSPGMVSATGVTVGSTVVVDGEDRTVSGVAVRRWSAPGERLVFAPPSASEPSEAGPTAYWLADLDDLDGSVVLGLQDGLEVLTRDELDRPGWRGAGLRLDGESTVVLAVAITLVVLEIALLAGPAFAVGVRQQQQTLALLAASGGDARALRRVVLAQALLIGAVSTVAGALLGTGLVAASLSLARYRVRFPVGPTEVPWGFVLLFVAIGAVAAVAAALVPAATASRSTVVGALAVRPTERRVPRWRPLGGFLLCGLGAGQLWAATMGIEGDATLQASSGILLLGVGMVLVVPLPVALMARATTRLPLGVRLAGRESTRSATRTVAAVAAVAGASATLVAALVATSAFRAEEQLRYVPQTQPGVTSVRPSDGTPLADVRDRVSELVPGAAAGLVGDMDDVTVDGSYRSTQVSLPSEGCPLPESVTDDVCRYAWSGFDRPAAAVLDPSAAVLLGYGLTGDQLGVLEAGGVLLAEDSPAVTTDRVQIQVVTTAWDVTTEAEDISRSGGSFEVARYAAAEGRPALLVGERAARALGIWVPDEVLVQTTAGPVDLDDRAAVLAARADAEPLRAAFDDGGPFSASVHTETGLQDRWTPVQLGVLVAAAAVVLGATFTATALALADARRDRAVLTAVGASPGAQRTAAGSTAALVAGTGAFVGALVGLVPGLLVGAAALRPSAVSAAFGLDAGEAGPGVLEVAPWGWVVAFVVGLPVLAGLLVAAVATGRPDAEAARASARVG